MRMEQRQFRIGELAKHVGVERFVIRFWEKEFNLKPTRSDGGQRFYQNEDLHKFKTIKTLLYDQGFTIAGAKQQLTENGFLASAKTTMDETTSLPKSLKKQLINLRAQLQQLNELL